MRQPRGKRKTRKSKDTGAVRTRTVLGPTVQEIPKPMIDIAKGDIDLEAHYGLDPDRDDASVPGVPVH